MELVDKPESELVTIYVNGAVGGNVKVLVRCAILVTHKISHVEPVRPKPELVPMSACGAIGEPAKRDHVRLEKPKPVNAACAVLKQEAVLVNVHGKIGDHALEVVCAPLVMR